MFGNRLASPDKVISEMRRSVTEMIPDYPLKINRSEFETGKEEQWPKHKQKEDKKDE